jgi:hypothetical protein
MEGMNVMNSTSSEAVRETCTLLQFVRLKGVKSPAEVKNAFQAWMRRGEHLPKAVNQGILDENRQNNLTGRATGSYRVTDLEQAWKHWVDVRRSNHD